MSIFVEYQKRLRKACESLTGKNEVLSPEDQNFIIQQSEDAYPIRHFYDEMKGGKDQSFVNGLIAGSFLCRAIIKHQLGEIETLKETAIICIKSYKGVSLSTFNNTIWPRYKNVAHFWAASYFNYSTGYDKKFPCDIKNFKPFLALAEYFKIAGENLRGKGADTCLLKKGDAYKFPNSWKVEPTTQITDYIKNIKRDPL